MRDVASDVPRGWQLAGQVGYPKVLLIAYGPDGARLVLGAQRVTPGQGAIEMAAGARAVLIRQGYAGVRVTPEVNPGTSAAPPAAEGAAPASDRIRLDATFNAGRQVLRQWYIVDVDVAVVVTVTAQAEHPQALKAVEAAAATLVFDPNEAPGEAPEVPRVPPLPLLHAPVDGGVDFSR